MLSGSSAVDPGVDREEEHGGKPTHAPLLCSAAVWVWMEGTEKAAKVMLLSFKRRLKAFLVVRLAPRVRDLPQSEFSLEGGVCPVRKSGKREEVLSEAVSDN